jgi:hypothetical protein
MAKEISKTFGLKPEESVVLRANKVGFGPVIDITRNELILTNQAIIFINKDLFGKTKEVTRYPLEDICLSGGKPQVALGPDSHVSGTLDVYLQYETLSFRFEWATDVEEWVASITEIVTGEKVARKDPFGDFAGLEKLVDLTDSMTGSVNSLKKAFGIKSNEAAACKCSSCGASLSGIKDEVVICPYCGTSNKL